MNCAHAQQLLSEAVDREPVPDEMLEEARAHCRECPECAGFVRGLAAVQRAESPVPPARLRGRVMAAIDAEAERVRLGEASSATAAGATTAEAPPPATSVSPSSMPAGAERASVPVPSAGVERLRDQWRRDPWKMAAWVGAAAVVLVALGFATVIGVRSGMSPAATSSRESATVAEDGAADKSGGEAGVGGTELASPAAPPATDQSAPSAAPGVVPDYITVDGVVYRSSGTAALAQSELTTAGTTSTSLDSGGDAQIFTVFATPTSGRVAIVSNGRTIAFDRVTRTFQGRAYVLTSAAIETFGRWPSLPSGFDEPVTPEGAPTFVPGSEDDLGVQVFTRPGISIDDGFALGPKTSSSDPAQNNPNWTWWVAAN